MNSFIVSVSGLTKNFEDIRALDKLELKTSPGIFGLIGPNGAGKTTLIRILLVLIRPSAGSAQVLDFDVVQESLEVRRKVGVLHEKVTFPRHMEVSYYLEKVAKLYHSRRTPEELLELVDLSYAGQRQIGKLSAGMHQRLGIAQALAGNPKLVFLDEPTSNLDVEGRGEVIALIVKMHQELGISFFISSHSLPELEIACHTVAFISKGRIIEAGKIPDIIKKHTKEKIRLRTSNPLKLLEEIKHIQHIDRVEITGATSITISIEPRHIDFLKSEIEKCAKSLSIEIYAFEDAETLVDAYKEIMMDE
jgi:ABC-2 type transport system ATP-binding protein